VRAQAQDSRSSAVIERQLAELAGWPLYKLAFGPGSASHYHTSVNLHGEHDEANCSECWEIRLTNHLTRMEHRWGHAGRDRLPCSRRPYARRKRRRRGRFVEDVKPLDVAHLYLQGIEHVDAPVADHEGRTRRYWICPLCRRWAQRLYPTERGEGDDPETLDPGAGCRQCARLVYKSHYEGKALVTPERIKAAYDRGPRRPTSPARVRYELRLLLAELQLQQRTRQWEQRWGAAVKLWLAWHLVQATRMQVRLARLQLAEVNAVQASREERRAARDELQMWRERKHNAQDGFERAKAAYDALRDAA
jgi:hypothetical protein